MKNIFVTKYLQKIFAIPKKFLKYVQECPVKCLWLKTKIAQLSPTPTRLFLLDCCQAVTVELTKVPAGAKPDWLGIYVVTWRHGLMEYIKQPGGHESLHIFDGMWSIGGAINSVDYATCPADIRQWQYDAAGHWDGFGDISVKCI